jgi:poly-gamma-glutamate synthesis protein (capsule biosynthesis protein)
MLNFLKKRHPSLLFFILIICLTAFFGSFFTFEFTKFNKEISQLFLAQVSTPLEKQTKPATLIFVGDIMLDRGVEWSINKYGKGDFKFPFLRVAEELNKADILVGNLESVISDKGQKVGSIYSFRAEPEAMEGLTFAGFDIVSVANNHVFDYSRAAMEDSFKRLKTAGIDYIGGGFNEKEARSPVIKNIDGIKIAFLAYSNLGSKYWISDKTQSGISNLTKENIEEDIMNAKRQSDLVVVSFHFGDEYQTKSNSNQQFWAHLAIDSGVDLVIGHHPHVVQEIEEYKGKYIAYSLGNFVFDQGFSKETMEGLLLKVIVENAKIKEAIPVKIQINQFFQPEIAGE